MQEAIILTKEEFFGLVSEIQAIKRRLATVEKSSSTVVVSELCKMPEAEKILGYKAKKIRELIEAKKVPAEKLYNGHYVFNRSELTALAPTLRRSSA